MIATAEQAHSLLKSKSETLEADLRREKEEALSDLDANNTTLQMNLKQSQQESDKLKDFIVHLEKKLRQGEAT